MPTNAAADLRWINLVTRYRVVAPGSARRPVLQHKNGPLLLNLTVSGRDVSRW